jgi:NTE family protein
VTARPFRIALVLAGGAARGAYEVGVVRYILEDVAQALGRPVRVDILCGTSVGAINACFLAAAADDPHRALRLVDHWRRLTVPHVVRVDPAHVWGLVRGLVGRAANPDRRGGLLDPTGLGRIVATGIDFPRIGENLRAGHLAAVTVSTTHIASGRTYVYVQRGDDGVTRWGRDATIVPRAAELTPAHALASAAIPFIFPAVNLDGEYHCDGGLRQNVPLSPARRLGASAMVVISPKYESPGGDEAEAAADANEASFPNPLFLLGKTLNALMLDRIENDIDRLQRITDFLEAGTRAYGPDFVDRLNRELRAAGGHAIRPIRAVLIRSSHNISQMAVDFVRQPRFASRATGMVGALFRRLAEERDSDLLSYLLFDGEFAMQLIDVGREDARANHDALCRLFQDRLDEAAREANAPSAHAAPRR